MYDKYTLDGSPLLDQHRGSTGLKAMNAASCLSTDLTEAKDFIDQLRYIGQPTGQNNYYDSILYLLGVLRMSGNFKIYKPGDYQFTPKPMPWILLMLED